MSCQNVSLYLEPFYCNCTSKDILFYSDCDPPDNLTFTISFNHMTFCYTIMSNPRYSLKPV